MTDTETKCAGCQRPELHKKCPAWGTEYYMSGIPFTEEVEEKIKQARRCGWEEVDKFYFDVDRILLQCTGSE